MSHNLVDLRRETDELLSKLGVRSELHRNGPLTVFSPIDGSEIANLQTNSATEVLTAISQGEQAFQQWKTIPAPRRGELIRLLGQELRHCKNDLGRLVSIEVGKILSEGLGEVQEMIDICDFAVGLSRQLYGKTIASERPGHRMMETWHPLGVNGVITAFNFPVAVWAWNTAIALICGNTVVWKPSEKSPLTALACTAIFDRALEQFDEGIDDIAQCVIGGADIGDEIVNDKRVPLISATGSTRMGRSVAPRVASRFGKCILELGGNNAMIVAPSADLDLAVRAIAFSAVGTAGQRCTSLRRIIVHESIFRKLVDRLVTSYGSLAVGSPLDEKTLVGPLIDKHAVQHMENALDQARRDGGSIHGGQRADGPGNGIYVKPAIVEMPEQTAIVREETFAPVLYALQYKTLQDAIQIHNDVPQGLASCIFTTDIREAEQFMSASGSDCGIVNVNIGPSGAEIGGAFGGEKETGGGRESGSDSWKAYMRRATNTVNYSTDLPLAQGVKFEI